MENLIYAGAFDCFGVYRSRLIGAYEEILDKAQAILKERESNQISFFTMLGEPEKIVATYPNVEEYELKTKLSYEKSVIGVYVSGHPLSNYEEHLKKYSFNTLKLLSKVEDENGDVIYTDVSDGMTCAFGGIITEMRKINTRSGQVMCVLTLEDLFGTIEAVLYPKVYQKFASVIEVDNVISANGKLQIRDGHEPSLMIENIAPLVSTQKTENKVEVKRQYLAINASGLDNLDDLLEILSGYPGEITVYIKRDGKTYKLSEKIRNCRGLISELESILSEEDIIFVEK